MKRLASIVIVLGLTGCGGGGMEDLRTFVAETGKDMQGKIEPLTEVKAYEPFTYDAFDLPDPFKPRKLSRARIATSATSPTSSSSAPPSSTSPIRKTRKSCRRFSSTIRIHMRTRRESSAT